MNCDTCKIQTSFDFIASDKKEEIQELIDVHKEMFPEIHVYSLIWVVVVYRDRL